MGGAKWLLRLLDFLSSWELLDRNKDSRRGSSVGIGGGGGGNGCLSFSCAVALFAGTAAFAGGTGDGEGVDCNVERRRAPLLLGGSGSCEVLDVAESALELSRRAARSGVFEEE